MPEGARRVLLAEDDRFLRRAAEARLRRHGLEVLTAVDGEEALRIARAERLDLVLLDVVMPKLEGSVLKLLKEDEATASIRSSSVESRSGARRRSGQALGAVAFLVRRTCRCRICGSGGRRARDGDDLARRLLQARLPGDRLAARTAGGHSSGFRWSPPPSPGSRA